MPVRILFVCGRNKWRSPTAERLYRKDARIEARSAGTSPKSPRQIRAADIEWADCILVMEQQYARWIREHFRDLEIPKIECLEIPDDYQYMDAELIELLELSVEPLLA